jgi:predicted DCC family thiol-disulfide oxidoreductase YuxK
MSAELRAQVILDNSEVGGEKYKSIVVCGPEKTYIESSAVFQILQSLGGTSKRLKVIQYLALLGYVLPTKARDGVYKFISKRRKRWFGSADECLLWDDRFDDRFVDDGVLTGVYRDPFADPHAKVSHTSTNLFEGNSPPVRGNKVRIVWPADSNQDPSVSYDDEFPDGICIIGGTGTISTIDLPMRIVMRVDRESIGMSPDENGEQTMIAWVKPGAVAMN